MSCSQYDSASQLGIKGGYACGLKESCVVDSAVWPDWEVLYKKSNTWSLLTTKRKGKKDVFKWLIATS